MNDLVEKAIHGDKEAFISAIDKCTPILYKLGYKLGMNDEDTGDAMQDSILSAYEKISILKNPEYFKTWLIEIVSAKLTPTGFTISYKDKQNKNSNAEDIGSSFLTANNKMYPVTSSSDKDGIITADFNNISSFDKCGDITFNLQYFSQDGIKKIVLVK